MSTHPADRLIHSIERAAAPLCVGIDPVHEKLPAPVRDDAAPLAGIERFCIAVIDAVRDRAACVKLQSACFERYRAAGVSVLFDLIGRCREIDLPVVLDAKRGDIGISADHYGAATFGSDPATDWLTVSGYLGEDSLQPLRGRGGGLFVLVRTSNPGSGEIQDAPLREGGTVAERMAGLVAVLGGSSIGERGYSDLGAVVGATQPATLATLRSIMPRQILLLPGIGAQGARIDDVESAFNADGLGAIVTASRSIIYAGADRTDWLDAVRRSADDLAEQLGMLLHG